MSTVLALLFASTLAAGSETMQGLPPPLPPPPLPPLPSHARLVSAPFGDVHVWLERDPTGAEALATAVGVGVIAVAPEQVFNALLDHGHYPEWVPFLLAAAAIRRPDGSVLHRQRLDLPFPLGVRSYEIVASAGHDGEGTAERWWTGWELAPGSSGMVRQTGRWTLAAAAVPTLGREDSGGAEAPPGPSPGGRWTWAELRLQVDPGGPIPRFLLERGALRALPWTFDGLRQQVRRGRYQASAPLADRP